MSTYGLRRRNSIGEGGREFMEPSSSLTVWTQRKFHSREDVSRNEDGNNKTICHDIEKTGDEKKERKTRSKMDDKTSSKSRRNRSMDNNNTRTRHDGDNNNNNNDIDEIKEDLLDILSLEGESLRGSSFEDDDYYDVNDSSKETKRSKRSTRDDSNNHLLPDPDNESHEREDSFSSSTRTTSQDKKAISALLTLRFEGMTSVLRNEKEVRIPSRSRYLSDDKGIKMNKRNRMIKVSQQISRGASSFLVFSGEVFPGSDFRFPVYRKNSHHPFSLSIFVDNVRDVRISTCCENKHQPGSSLGHFRVISVQSSQTDPSMISFRCEACIKGIPWQEWIRRSQRGKKLEPLPSPLIQTPRTSLDQQRIPSASPSRSSSSSSLPSEMDYKEELEKYNNMHSSSLQEDDDDQEKKMEVVRKEAVTEIDGSGEEIAFDEKASMQDIKGDASLSSKTITSHEKTSSKRDDGSSIDSEASQMRGSKQEQQEGPGNRIQEQEGSEGKTSPSQEDQGSDPNQVESLVEEVMSPSSLEVTDQLDQTTEEVGEEVSGIEEEEGEVTLTEDSSQTKKQDSSRANKELSEETEEIESKLESKSKTVELESDVETIVL
jgi:hypothetical protein